MSSKFIHGERLNMEVNDLIRKAEKYVLLISPYIKFHARVIDALQTHLLNNDLKIEVLFGKNDEQVDKSLSYEAVEFLQQFRNIEIRHEPRLHAKFYANESTSILTSMNLYDYSMNNNIESGVLLKTKTLLGNNDADAAAFNYFQTVFNNANVLYHKHVSVASSFGGLRKKYSDPKVLCDTIADYYPKYRSRSKMDKKRNDQYSVEYPFVNIDHNRSSSISGGAITGYCIRTGEEIPFNPRRPFSYRAYSTWAEFGNEDYPERYCHQTGRESFGETSYSKPIL